MKTIYRILGKRGRITVPFEIRQRVGFSHNDVLSFTKSEDGKSVTIKREIICGSDNCVKETDKREDTDKVTLFDFLNGLSAEQQRAALVHLSVKWAEKQGGEGLA